MWENSLDMQNREVFSNYDPHSEAIAETIDKFKYVLKKTSTSKKTQAKKPPSAYNKVQRTPWHRCAACGTHNGLMEEMKQSLKKCYKSIKKIPANQEKKWTIDMKRLFLKIKYRWFLKHMKRGFSHKKRKSS